MCMNTFIEDYDWDGGVDSMINYVKSNKLNICELIQIFYDADGYSYLMFRDSGCMGGDLLKLHKLVYGLIVEISGDIGDVRCDCKGIYLSKVQKYKIQKMNPGIPDVLLNV